MANHRAVLFCFAGLLGGCAEEVSGSATIEDLRVLAVRAEPPEVLTEPETSVENSSARSARFEALVVDPQGRTVSYEWSFCPVESNETCDDYDRRKAEAPPEFQTILDTTRAQRLAGQSPIPADGIAARPRTFEVEIPFELFRYHLAESALGTGNGAWVSAVLRVQAGRDAVIAQKRLVLNARDLAAFNPELSRAGLEVCPSEGVAEGPQRRCLPLHARTANRNPEVLGIEVARGRTGDASFELLKGALILNAGEKVRVRPVLAEDAEETFELVEPTLQTNDLRVRNRREELVVSWFTTGGKFAESQTAVHLTRGLDNTFTPPEHSAGKTLTLFLVVRDQRGGVDWTQIDATVQ